MAQTRELFFDAETVEGLPDRVYQAADWPAIFGRSFTDGYLDLDEWTDPLLVEASDPAAMTVEVNDGAAWLQGRFFEIYDGPQTLVVPEADPANPRIDRVVVRLDLAERVISLALLQGTAAASPSAPALTRTSTIWELSLAQLAIGAGATSVASGNITDERDDDTLCGVAESALASGSSGTHATVDTAESTTSTTFTDLATIGPQVTVEVGPSGLLFVSVHALIRSDTVGAAAVMGFEISDPTAVGASDARALMLRGDVEQMASWTRLFTGQPPGSYTITAKYKSGTLGAEAFFRVRGLNALAL